MAKFFVGQRVRIVKVGMRSGHLYGRETVVAAIGSLGYDPATNEFYQGIETPERINGGGLFVAPESFFEPILPEGHQPSEFATLADLLASLEVTA